jgi:hypothetical protein
MRVAMKSVGLIVAGLLLVSGAVQAKECVSFKATSIEALKQGYDLAVLSPRYKAAFMWHWQKAHPVYTIWPDEIWLEEKENIPLMKILMIKNGCVYPAGTMGVKVIDRYLEPAS